MLVFSSLFSHPVTLKFHPLNNSIFNLHFTSFNPPSLRILFPTSKPQARFQSHHDTHIRSLFTGIVEEMGEIKHIGVANHGGFEVRIGAKKVLGGLNLGDSISVNGTCLTVTEHDAQFSEFVVGLSPETIRKTSLIELIPGSSVNLERALTMETRMGGHFVQGHVDGTGEIMALETEGDSLWVRVRTSPKLLKYIVPKGYVAVDGASLTVVNVFDDEECFNFMLVAYTRQHVVIPLKKVGQKVNLEVDILSKYVERLLNVKSS